MNNNKRGECMKKSINKIVKSLFLLIILLIPLKVEAKDFNLMFSFFSNGGEVASGNVEIISGVIFLKNDIKSDITYNSNQTISHINSLDETNTFTLKKELHNKRLHTFFKCVLLILSVVMLIAILNNPENFPYPTIVIAWFAIYSDLPSKV